MLEVEGNVLFIYWLICYDIVDLLGLNVLPAIHLML